MDPNQSQNQVSQSTSPEVPVAQPTMPQAPLAGSPVNSNNSLPQNQNAVSKPKNVILIVFIGFVVLLAVGFILFLIYNLIS